MVKWMTSAASAPTPDNASGHQCFFTGAGAGASTPASNGSACMPRDLIASVMGSVPGRL
ncbi:hypothetical protein D3C78_1941440 [compost metagenome]